MHPPPRFRYDYIDRGLRVFMCPTMALKSFYDSNRYMIEFLCTYKGSILNHSIPKYHYLNPPLVILILLNYKRRYFSQKNYYMLTVEVCKFSILSVLVVVLCFMEPKRSGKVVRLEPEGTKLLEAYPQMVQRFRDTGWFEFLTTFQGHDEHVSLAFEEKFDGYEVEIEKLLMLVTEQTIAKACRLVVRGERWWKKEHVVTKFVNQFLLSDKQNLD
jgi:hypothetical protein